MTEKKVPNRWIFVVAGCIINICLGTVYAWSVFRPPLHKPPFNLSPAESVLPFSVFLLLFGITFAFAGRMVGKVGPRKPALIGAVLVGVGYILSYTIAFAPQAALWITVVTFGLIAGTGCGYAYNPPIATVGRWFPDKRGLATGLTVLGFGLSALITAPPCCCFNKPYWFAEYIPSFGNCISNTSVPFGFVDEISATRLESPARAFTGKEELGLHSGLHP
jgi:MFS family permease